MTGGPAPLPADLAPARRLGPWPPLALLGLVLAVVGDVVVRREVVLGLWGADISAQFLPWLDFGFRELRGGNLALWNPYCYSGHPFFGDFQTGLLYPPNWLHLLLPTVVAVNVGLAGHLLLAGYFTALWTFSTGASRAAATLAGVVYMLSGGYFLHVPAGHLPLVQSMSWAPLVLLCLDRLFDGGDRRWLLLGMLAAAMQVYAGHPQFVYYGAVAAGLYTVLHACRLRRPRLLLVPAAMYGGAALLSAVQVLAGMETTAESWRAGRLPYGMSTQFALPPENLLTLVAPGVLGDLSQFSYFGRGLLWEASLFVGGAALVLAVYGAVNGAGKGRRRVLTIAAAVMLALALANRIRIHWLLYHVLPGYGHFRVTGRFAHLFTLFLAGLAAMGFDGVRSGPRVRWRWPAGTAAAAAALGIAGAVVWASAGGGGDGLWGRFVAGVLAGGESFFNFAQYTTPAFVRAAGTHAAGQLAWAAGVLLLVAAALVVARRRPAAVYALLVLAAVELFVPARGNRGTMHRDRMRVPEAWRELAAARAPGDDGRVLVANPAARGVAMMAGFEEIWGYDPAALGRYTQFMARTQFIALSKASHYLSINHVPPVFAMLRLRYILSDDPARPVTEVPGAMSRLHLLTDYRVIADRRAVLSALTDETFDPRRTVILETPPEPAPEPSAAPGVVRLVASSTDVLEIEVDLSSPAILLITDSYSAGWRARGLGETAQSRYEILPANCALRAIPLSAGRHHLLMEYAPPLYRVGKWVTLIAVAAWAFAMVLALVHGVRK